MKKVILVCNGGMSTSIMANRINELGGGNYEVTAYGEQEYLEHLDGVDCVLIGPQIRYLLPNIKKIVGESVPVESIEPKTYGTMNAAKVIEQVDRLTNKD